MKKFKCSICGRGFSSPDAVAQHAGDSNGRHRSAPVRAVPLPARLPVVDDDDVGDLWRAKKAESAERRAGNRDMGAALLRAAKIAFVSKNGGAHLVVDDAVDYWPGTGLWHSRNTPIQGRGIRNLLRHLGVSPAKIEEHAHG